MNPNQQIKLATASCCWHFSYAMHVSKVIYGWKKLFNKNMKTTHRKKIQQWSTKKGKWTPKKTSYTFRPLNPSAVKLSCVVYSYNSMFVLSFKRSKSILVFISIYAYNFSLKTTTATPKTDVLSVPSYVQST